MSRPIAHAGVFNALADPTRRAVLHALRGKDRPATDLARSAGMSPSAMSQHLTVLTKAGLVEQRRSGRQRIYKLQAAPLKEIADWVFSFEEFWDSKLGALSHYLQEEK